MEMIHIFDDAHNNDGVIFGLFVRCLDPIAHDHSSVDEDDKLIYETSGIVHAALSPWYQ